MGKQNHWITTDYEVKRPSLLLGWYGSLDEAVKRQAKKAYRLWAENPFHPSLHFKCINAEEDVWSGLTKIMLQV